MIYYWCCNIFKIISIKKLWSAIMLSLFESTSFSKQLRRKIFLIKNRFWPLITDRSYYSSYNICMIVHMPWRKGTLDWMMRNEGLWQKCSAQSVFSLDGHIRIPPSIKYMKFTNLYRSSYKITLFLVLKISFVQKVFLFTLSSKYFPLYLCLHDCVILFSLVFAL